MDQQQRTGPDLGSADDVRLLDLASVVIGEWRLIARVALLFVALGVGGYLLWPKSYVARTVLLPAQEASGASAQLWRGQIPTGLLGLAGMSSPNHGRIRAIARSNTFADSMVARLGDAPGSTAARQVRRSLDDARLRREDDGSLVVQIPSRSRERAERIAQEFPPLLNAMAVQLGAAEALRKQEFVERQLAVAGANLETSEAELLHFQQTHEAPEVQEQARRTLDAAAALRRQIIEQEVKVAQLRRIATPDNPELRAALSDVSAWRAQLEQLAVGQVERRELFFSLRESPELQLAATRLVRQYKQDEQVFLSLAETLVETQVSARNDLPVVSVLDPARVPLRPNSYPLAGVALLAAFLGIAVGTAAALGREYARRARLDPGNARFFSEVDRFRVDVTGALPHRLGRRREPVRE